MRKTYYIWAAVIIVIVLAGWGLLSSQKSVANRTVRIGYLPVVHALPLYLAIDRGYFEDAGINVEVTKFEAPNQIIDALLSDKIDVAMAAATGITAVAESKKPGSLKIFAVQGGDSTHVAEALIVQKESLIKTIPELKGKKVGVLPGIQWRTIAQNLFAQNGLDISTDLTLVELAVPLQGPALASKQVDALLAIEPVLTLASSTGASRTLVISPNLQYISNPFYAGVGNVSVAFISRDHDLFKQVLKIFDRATAEVNSNVDAARPHLATYTPLSGDLLKTVNLPVYKMYTDMDPADFAAVQEFIDVFVKYKVIENPVTAADLIYHD